MKAARVGKDLTQEDLAQQIDVSRQTISAIEKGNYNPSVNLCIRICQALDKTLDDLFWPEEKEDQDNAKSDELNFEKLDRVMLLFVTKW